MEGINGAVLRKRIARRFSRYGEHALLEQRLQQVVLCDQNWRKGNQRTELESEI
jgi:hypothetical protein